MTPVKRTLAAVSVPLLLAVSLSACGGGGGDDGSAAPDAASSDDFCSAMSGVLDLGAGTSDDDNIDAAHTLADKLSDTGTPKDMSDSERNGFENYVDTLGGLSTDDVKNLADADEKDVFGDDTDDVDAFLTYWTSNCAPGGGDVPTDLPSGLPTDLPS